MQPRGRRRDIIGPGEQTKACAQKLPLSLASGRSLFSIQDRNGGNTTPVVLAVRDRRPQWCSGLNGPGPRPPRSARRYDRRRCGFARRSRFAGRSARHSHTSRSSRTRPNGIPASPKLAG